MFSIFRGTLFPVCLILIGAFLTYAGHKNAKEFAALSSHGSRTPAPAASLRSVSRAVRSAPRRMIPATWEVDEKFARFESS
jgi:hypothetical protein